VMLANPSTEGVLSLFHDMETVCLALPVSSSEMWIALWRFYTYRRRLERTQRFGSLLLQVCHFVTSLRSHPNFVAFDRPEGNEEMGEMGTSFGGSFCLSNVESG
jgi:hypothetical protein